MPRTEPLSHKKVSNELMLKGLFEYFGVFMHIAEQKVSRHDSSVTMDMLKWHIET